MKRSCTIRKIGEYYRVCDWDWVLTQQEFSTWLMRLGMSPDESLETVEKINRNGEAELEIEISESQT